jgi:hypothetical protein
MPPHDLFKIVVESTGEMNVMFTCHVDKIAKLVNLTTSKPDP